MFKFSVEFGHVDGTMEIEVSANSIKHAVEVATARLPFLVVFPRHWEINGVKKV